MAAEGDAPRPLLDRPEIGPGLEYVWDAFWELCSDRPVGFVVGRIPFTAVDRYADRFQVEDFDLFRRLIRAMDDFYLEHAERRSEAAKKDR